MIPERKCPDRQTVFAFIHKMLGPAEESDVRHHLDQCDECRRVAEGFTKLDALLHEWKPAEPSPGFDARLKQALAARGPAQTFRFSFSSRPTRIFAATLAVLLLVAGAFLVREMMKPRGAQQGSQPVAEKTHPPRVEQHAPQPPPQVATRVVPQAVPVAKQEQHDEGDLNADDDLPAPEDYDMLANFEVLSEIAGGGRRVGN